MIRIEDLKPEVHHEQDVIVLDRGVRAYGKLQYWTPGVLAIRLETKTPSGMAICLTCNPKHATFASAVRSQ